MCVDFITFNVNNISNDNNVHFTSTLYPMIFKHVQFSCCAESRTRIVERKHDIY